MVHMLYADQLSVVLDCGEQSYGVGVRWVLGAWRVSETVDWNLLAGSSVLARIWNFSKKGVIEIF